jgi:hypothetical protein
VRLPRLVVPIAAVSLVLPLVVAASAGGKSTAPTFQQYTSPVGVNAYTGIPEPLGDVVEAHAPFGIYTQTGVGDSCGEPTLGVDEKTGNVLYQCGLQTLRITGFGKGGKATWTPVQPLVESLQSSDPILWRDPDTGRVFVNQLMPQGCSLQAYSDDFGATWTQGAVGCGIGISFDHQTIVTGRPRTLPASPAYPNLVYYCTNDWPLTVGPPIADCSVSLDGGLTYGPTHPMSTDPDETCSQILGHIKTAPDGTLYAMPDGCNDEAGDQAVFVSTDNSISWTKRSIPHATEGDAGHPSIAVGSDGTLYAAWGSADNAEGGGRVRVAVSRDKGAHWTSPKPLGKELGVHVSRFPLAVAGDGDRAAVAYLGSKASGNPGRNKTFFGAWHMYVSYTYDRGRTWKTYDATPKSPVQVGSVCTGGLSCTSGPTGDRNLLDFNDMVIDGKGHVVIAFADGCLKAKGCTTKDRLRKGAIIRQLTGKSLYRDRG